MRKKNYEIDKKTSSQPTTKLTAIEKSINEKSKETTSLSPWQKNHHQTTLQASLTHAKPALGPMVKLLNNSTSGS